MNKSIITLISLGLTFISCFVYAVEESYPFDDVQQQKIFGELVEELRCPKCQNQNIADSNAMVAIDLKNKTYELVKQGQSKDQVIDFMVQRYGQFVHYDPPINMVTIWLWLVPIAIALILVVFVLKKGRREKLGSEVDANSLDQAQAIIDKLESKGKS
ncbi:cytochrome C biogenesis protein [Catenovulum agarivorans DS-2]|uniref:Cytochrome c-type biogenesis protein n=1 Tax=Catenovulum agarivorans DS-2 TaxID=1328313 RepID=W7QGZ5_9ALTE|nr:cytochrome c-type biogenesis protein [Catenovulum agarivorans]EWH12214.1 cytochrome C biogenesis protein [Catenovulum agarivorans DS-2]